MGVKLSIKSSLLKSKVGYFKFLYLHNENTARKEGKLAHGRQRHSLEN